jgi:galactokinase
MLPAGVRSAFEELFGRPPSVIADAPGRVNLIGEHTDYNGGWVLPATIPRRARASCAPRAGADVRVASAAVVDPFRIEGYTLGQETPGRGWLDYVQGLTWALREDGHAIGGFDLHIASTVPLGGGLASSAALEVAVLRAVRQTFALVVDDVRLALLGQRAENEFVGARVGIMDQMAASLGEAGQALLIDTRSLAARAVPLPFGAEVAVIDSGVRHAHATGGYNARRAECERACALLGIRQLRDLDEVDGPARAAALPPPLDRRVRHVLSENGRVLAAVAALEQGDLPRLGALLGASHRSLRDDYEVSVAEVDRLAALAEARPEVYGARLTGGGFGGSVVVLVRAGSARAIAARVAEAYSSETGREATVLVAGRL